MQQLNPSVTSVPRSPASARVGVLGAGQLGRMLALAGYPLGVQFCFLDPASDAPAGQLAPLLVGDYEDRRVLERLGAEVDLVTYEFENVPVAAVEALSSHVPVYPSPAALEVAQDRLVEKTFFRQLGIPTPDFAPLASRAELDAAIATIGLPAVLKTRRFGYDGKGQVVLRTPADVEQGWQTLQGAPLILEQWVAFDRELSILAVRARSGAILLYPLVENTHRAGILHLSRAPAPGLTPAFEASAVELATQALNALDYVGVLAIELFQVGDDLLVNEMAPRVHNSGHWTIEGAETSQFANHLRAILDLPLGSTAALGHAAMVNLVGTLPDIAAVLALPDAYLHLYGKAPRPGRKLGHVTLRGADATDLDHRLQRLLSIIP